MLAKLWKNVLLAICVIAILFNITSKFVRRYSLDEELDSVANGKSLSSLFGFEKKESKSSDKDEKSKKDKSSDKENNVIENEEVIEDEEIEEEEQIEEVTDEEFEEETEEEEFEEEMSEEEI